MSRAALVLALALPACQGLIIDPETTYPAGVRVRDLPTREDYLFTYGPAHYVGTDSLGYYVEVEKQFATTGRYPRRKVVGSDERVLQLLRFDGEGNLISRRDINLEPYATYEEAARHE